MPHDMFMQDDIPSSCDHFLASLAYTCHTCDSEDMNALDPGPHTRVLMGTIDEERKAHEPRITQREIADVAGVHQGQVSRLLAGKRPITYDQLYAISRLLDTSVADIVRRAELRMKADQAARREGSAGFTTVVSAAHYDELND